jgi:hypothetical protein
LACPEKTGGIYRYLCGEKEDYKILIIDENRVRERIHNSKH